MYVRLAFAIAAHVDADTLVIDEALSVGDVRFTQKCMRYLREFQQRGTLLFVSHDTSAVTSLCSRAIWLDSGRMMKDGTAREVVEYYLAEQHAADRASLGQTVTVRSSVPVAEAPAKGTVSVSNVMPVDVVDPRNVVLNGGATRNLVEVFEFDTAQINNEFGAGAARIVDVQLLDSHGEPHRLMAGGEIADLMIEAEVIDPLEAPIFGFYVKDRLGQRLFGDNTYVSYRDQPVHAQSGARMRAHFRFRMPVLPSGDYSVDVALATGVQENHTQQHWIHDALTFRASESTMRHGLVGIPMHSIEIEHVGK
jgi:lipopolysaccharide transport system ATP-binding protein